MHSKKRSTPKFYEITDGEYAQIEKLAYPYIKSFSQPDREDLIQIIALRFCQYYNPKKWTFSTLVTLVTRSTVRNWLDAKRANKRIPEFKVYPRQKELSV